MGTFPVNLPRQGAVQAITFIPKINLWSRVNILSTEFILFLRANKLMHFPVSENCFLKHLFQGSDECQHFLG